MSIPKMTLINSSPLIKNNKSAKLTLAHINDTHSYFEPQPLQLKLTIEGKTLSPYVSNGGFSRIATRVAQLRETATEKNDQHALG